jgi:tRNA (guanine-N7-)-methyltransferase
MMMQRHENQFEWLAERPKDFLEPSGGWIETRYGAKSRREGRRPYYLRYRRTG